MKPTFAAYRHQFSDLTTEYRVAKATKTHANQAPTKLGRPLAIGLTRDAAWKECRRLARGAQGLAFLMGIKGLAAPPVAFNTYSLTIGDPDPKRDSVAARLTTYDLDKSSAEFRKMIATWLREQAAHIVAYGARGTLDHRYKATYYRRLPKPARG